MIRLIKRYGSRKLYDTEESRYVLLEDVAAWIRQGQEIRVIDNKTGDDVTAQTLTQIISEEGRRGTTTLPSTLLHDLIRTGQEAVSGGVERIQERVDRVVRASIDRLGPVRQAREEMEVLRQRLIELEASLIRLEAEQKEEAAKPAAPKRPAAAKKASGGATKTPSAKRPASTAKVAGKK